MAQQYPDYAQKPVCFALQCVENPPGSYQPFFTAMSNFAAGEGIRWVARVRLPGVG